MIYETNYLTTSQYPNYFDPYWQHPYPHKISFHTMDNVKLRESFVHPVSGKHRYEHPIMRRKFESRGNSRYNDRHYYGEGSPYLFSEEEAEEGEYDPHSSNHYGSRKFYHSDQYPEMTRLASIPHIRQTREMQQVSRLHHKSKDDAVPWPQSAVYVTQPMMLVDPVLTQPHYQQHQQQILGICTTDLMPGRLLSPPQMPMTAASPLSKPGNNNLVVPPISHLQNVSVIHPLHSAHHIQNQPCFLNMTSNQPTSFPAFPQQFFTSPSLNLLQQPQQELTLPSAFLNPTNFLGLPQASVIEKKTDNSSKPNTSNEQTPVEGLHSSTSPSVNSSESINLTSSVTAAHPSNSIPQRRRSVMENILSSMSLLQPGHSSNHNNYVGYQEDISREQLPTKVAATASTSCIENSSGNDDISKAATFSPTSNPSFTTSENVAPLSESSANLNRLSRRTSLKLFRKASELRKRQYLWCYRPQYRQEANTSTTTTTSTWIAFDVKNQLKMDGQYALLFSKNTATMAASQQKQEQQGTSGQQMQTSIAGPKQDTTAADEILTLYKQSQISGPMMVSVQRGIAWSFDSNSSSPLSHGLNAASSNHPVKFYDIACIPCQESKFVISDSVFTKEKKNTLRKSRSLEGLATKLLTTILK